MKLIATWLVLMALWAGTAVAQDSGVRCVQDMLRIAGHDPGPADGIAGRQSRRALAGFFHRNGGVAPPVRLTQDNGAVMCRLIGLTDPNLQQYWPSRTNQIDVLSSPRIAPEITNAVYGSALKILQRYRDEFGVELSLPLQFVVADDAADLERLLRENAESRLASLRAQAEIHCDLPMNGVAGLAYFDLLAVCLHPGQRFNGDFSRADITQVVAHELTHAVQAHLVGRAPRNYDLAREPGYRGPLWLTEGSAELMSGILSFRGLTPGEMADGLTDYLRSQTWPDLRRLEVRPTDEVTTSQLYSGGALAVSALLSPEPEDVPNLLGYYEDIGLGVPWRQAFENRFGRSIDQVYLEFQGLGPERK